MGFLTLFKKAGAISRGACPCSEKGCFFYQVQTKLMKWKSDEDLNYHMTLLIMSTLAASYQQNMTMCIVGAFCECIEACEQVRLPTAPDFHRVQFDGKSILVLLILDSPSGNNKHRLDQSTRHAFLNMILEEQPPQGAAVRDEMYLACAKVGSNSLFRLIRKRLGDLQEAQSLIATPSSHVIADNRPGHGHDLNKLEPRLKEEITVYPLNNGFRLEWTVPDFLQRLESSWVGTEFVAYGVIWGLYITAPDRKWQVRLCVLRPSQFEGTVSGYLLNFKHRVTMFAGGFDLTELKLATTDFPTYGAMPQPDTFWSLSERESNQSYPFIRKDGGSFLVLRISIKPETTTTSPILTTEGPEDTKRMYH